MDTFNTESKHKFVMYIDLASTSGNTNEGVVMAWFTDQASAERYLRQNKISITKVYINKLEPIE